MSQILKFAFQISLLVRNDTNHAINLSRLHRWQDFYVKYNKKLPERWLKTKV